MSNGAPGMADSHARPGARRRNCLNPECALGTSPEFGIFGYRPPRPS